MCDRSEDAALKLDEATGHLYEGIVGVVECANDPYICTDVATAMLVSAVHLLTCVGLKEVDIILGHLLRDCEPEVRSQIIQHHGYFVKKVQLMQQALADGLPPRQA